MADPVGDGFQIIQSLVAVGTGGVFGRGLMGGCRSCSTCRSHTPISSTRHRRRAGPHRRDRNPSLLLRHRLARAPHLRARGGHLRPFVALGLTTMIAAQALVNISVVLGLMPTKGIPLPLVSFGGSSLLINLLGMGVLLNISQHESSEHDAWRYLC